MKNSMMYYVLFCFIAYFIGSIPSGVWIGKFFYQKDIRDYGSGNMGTTNTFRVLGKKAGTIVLFCDILKGTLAASLPHMFGFNMNPLIIGLFAVIGHTFPIFANFRGGKAVATSSGILLAYNPLFFVYSAILFCIILFVSSRVSVASMLGLILISISTFILPLFKQPIIPIFNPLLSIIALVLTFFIIYRHRSNLHRILNGNENMVPFGLAYSRTKR